MISLRRLLSFAVVALLLGLGEGCARDPAVRKQQYFESGQNYFEKRDYRAASIEFRNALAIDADFAEAHYRLGLAYVELGQWNDAYRALTTAVERQPSLVGARLALARLLLLHGQPKDARAHIEAVQAVEPKNLLAQNLLAQTYLAESDYPQAIAEYGKALQLAPKEAFLWVSSGFARVLAKQYAAAEKDFRRAIDLDRNSVEAYRNLVNLLHLLGRGREVEPLLRQALEANPRSLAFHLVQAEAYLRQGRVQDVEELFARLRRRAADFQTNVRVEIGDFWTWHNEAARAVEEFQAALAEKPDVLLQKKLVSAYITLGRLEDAERLNETLLKANARDLEARFFRGALRHLRGDSAGAVQELRTALKDEPQSLFGNYYLGLALVGLGKLEEAEAAFLECVRLNQDFGQGFEQLAEIRLQRNDAKGALEYARRAVALLPRSAEGYLLLARVHLAQGEGRKAEQVLGEVAKKLALDSPAVDELLGNAYLVEGKFDAGVRHYQLAWTTVQDPLPIVDRFADALAAQGREDLAIRQVQQLNSAHAHAGYHEILARLYLKKGNLAAAEAAARAAIASDGSRWRARLYLGEAYDQLRRRDDAVGQYDEVIQSYPNLVPPYILAGDVRLRQGGFEQAGAYFEEARKRDPESPLVQHSLARLWAEQGKQLLEATSLVQGLQQRFPDDPPLSDTLAWIYYHKGLYTEALRLLQRCVQQQPGNSLFHYHLGMAYLKAGETTQGQRALERALQLGLNSDRWEAEARQALLTLRAEVK